MKVFTNDQLTTIALAQMDDNESKGCLDIHGDGVYRIYGGPNDGQPCNPNGRVTTLAAPNRPTTITAQPTSVPENSFSCPTPGSGNCLASIPRDDATENLQFIGVSNETTQVVELDNARGMNLCYISGFVTPALNEEPGSTMTDVEYQIAVDTLKSAATVTLRFRDQDVPGYTDIPIGEFIKVAGDTCCTAGRLNMDCLVPLYGGMELVFKNTDAGKIAGVIDQWQFNVEIKFSGCGCPSQTQCGCGGK